MTTKPHFSHENFKALLETEHIWPCEFTFKFIVESARLAEVTALFPNVTPVLRPSKNGKYVSASITVAMADPESVLAIYAGASKIEGIISL